MLATSARASRSCAIVHAGHARRDLSGCFGSRGVRRPAGLSAQREHFETCGPSPFGSIVAVGGHDERSPGALLGLVLSSARVASRRRQAIVAGPHRDGPRLGPRLRASPRPRACASSSATRRSAGTSTPASTRCTPRTRSTTGACWSFQNRGNPGWQAKVDDLVAQAALQASSFDVLTMKFCYIDPDASFTYYRDALLGLESDLPDEALRLVDDSDRDVGQHRPAGVQRPGAGVRPAPTGSSSSTSPTSSATTPPA